MALDDKQLAQLAHLARLQLDPAQAAALRADLDKMLDLASKVTAATAGTIAPVAHVQDGNQPLRPDQPEPAPAGLAQAAPDTVGGMVAVPKVVD